MRASWRPDRATVATGLRETLFGATVILWLLASAATTAHAGDAPARLGGVVVEPDGPGARVQILLSGSFRYALAQRGDHIVVLLRRVVAGSAVHPVARGPITRVTVDPVAGRASSTEVVITTRVPLEVVESFLEDGALVVRLAPHGAAMPPTRRRSGPTGPFVSLPSPPPATSSPSARSSPARPADVIAGRSVVHRTVQLETGSGEVLQVDGLVRVAVGDPRILGAVPVSSRELLVTGRAAGRTTMYVWEGPRRLLDYAVEVVPAADRIDSLRRLLASLFPSAKITVTEVPAAAGASTPTFTPHTGTDGPALPASPPGSVAIPPSVPPVPVAPMPPAPASPVSILPAPSIPGQPESMTPPAGPGSAADRFTAYPPGEPGAPSHTPGADETALVLSGMVQTQVDREKVEAIAHAFAPTVVDLLSVLQPVQLKLQVHVVELSRTALQSLGITWGGGQQALGSPPSLNGGVYNLQVITGPTVGTVGLDLLIAQLQALEQQGLAHLLADPSLVVLAGQTASLLLGGQVPIPVAGPYGTVTLEYKDFGVLLNVHPDYQDDGRVFMRIVPEVSTLDFADAIKVNGFTIPALRVRRAQTVVSMLPAQTLVLGGLLQRQDSTLIQKVPLLGDLPIIGPLFRSKTFQRQESDLVIFVTPVLAEPGGPTPPNP
jgi:Flp pilus assembly secretin CpaC